MTAQAGDTSTTSAAAQKQDLRRRLRFRRRQLPAGQRRLSEQRVARRLLTLPALRRARHVAVYLAVASELSTEPLIAALKLRRCRVYAPAVDHCRNMRFLPLDPSHRHRRDALGLRHPGALRGQRAPRQLDVVILPMVGFDMQGHRLGAGGGYYDRNFAFRRHRRGRPALIGVAFEAQRVDQLPLEEWDLRLDAVVTERRLYRCR